MIQINHIECDENGIPRFIKYHKTEYRSYFNKLVLVRSAYTEVIGEIDPISEYVICKLQEKTEIAWSDEANPFLKGVVSNIFNNLINTEK